MAQRDRMTILTRFRHGGVSADWRATLTSAIRVHFFIRSFLAFSPLLLAIPALADPAGKEAAYDVRGILAAVDQASFTTDLDAPVSKVSYREGDSFKRGDTLIAFDCRRQNAELASMKALQREMAVQLEGNLFLQRRGAAGKRDLEVSRARADRAAHDARALEVRLERCIIKAPFNGRLLSLPIHEHETPVAGKPILQIIGTNEIELQLIVPSLWLGWLKEGTKFTFNIDETGTDYDAKVRRIGAAVDPVSQTISLTGEILSDAPEVRAGMSGTASFRRLGG